jgi:hypothetical protein
VVLCICGTDMPERDDAHDDVTHWIGKLPKTDSDSTERLDKRDSRRQSKPDILSEELGVEKK